MRKWTKTTGLLFVAASAVYPNGAVLAQSAKGASATAATPAPAAPTTAPSTDSADPFAPAAPASQPAETTGQSVTDAQVNVTEEGTVEIHVNDANLNEVLRMLSLQLEKNILPSKEVRGTVTANLYDVTVREALDAILKANGFDYREKGNVIYVYTQKEIQDMEKASRVAKTEVFRLYYTPAANAATMIKPVLSTEAQVSMTTPALSGISGEGDLGGNSHATEDVLVVTDYPERLDQARRIIKEIDRKPQQILIEATILRATLTEDNSLGIDFTAVGGVDFSQLSQVGSGSTTGGGMSQAISGTIIDNPIAGLPGGVLDNGVAAGTAGGGGIKVGLVKNNVGLFIQALEGITDTVVLANPKVLVLNKQKGAVHVGSEQGYREAVTTETATADNVKFLETGTKLNFRPYIGDNGYVRLEIQPEDSSGSVNSSGLPNKSVTKVTSNVMVKDGHTIVIGGLFRESTTTTKSQVPGLGSLPIVGGLFGRRTDSTVREEVIILLTPHVVKDEGGEYAELSEEQARNAERIHMGMRHGLMPWGRGRMAEGHYRDAVKAYEKGDSDKALWHLGMAINLDPKMPEAHALRGRIQGRKVSSVDTGTVQGFVTRSILRDTAAATQPSADAAEEVEEPVSTAQATPEEPTTQPVATQDEPTTAPSDTTEATAPTEEVSDSDLLGSNQGNNTPVAPQQTPAEQRPEFANTPTTPATGNDEAANAPTGEEQNQAVTETPNQPVEGESNRD